MNPKLLQQLATIIKFGSMSAAAERLHVTQPTLTRSIQVIEQRAGAPVLIRTSSGVKPTEIGQRLANLGKTIDHYSNLSNAVIEQWQSGLNPEIRIGHGPLLGLGPLDMFLQSPYNNTKSVLHFVSSTASTLIQQLNDGDLDLVIAPINMDVKQSDLVKRAVFKDETRIFVGKKSSLYGCKQPVPFETLKQQNWITSGISAGFIENLDTTAFTSPASLVFSGGIDMVLSQLEQTDCALIMPYRLTLNIGRISPAHVINTHVNFARRDIAIWMAKSKLERPDIMKLANQFELFFQELDKTAIQLPSYD